MFKLLLQSGLVLCAMANGVVIFAVESKSPREINVLVGFELLPEKFLDSMGVERDSKSRFHHMGEVEAFFLICRDRKTDENWPLKRVKVVCNKAIDTTYKEAGKATKFRVSLVPSVGEDGAISMRVESPPDSDFKLPGKVTVQMPNKSVVYLPSSHVLPQGRLLYLVFSIDTGDEE